MVADARAWVGAMGVIILFCPLWLIACLEAEETVLLSKRWLGVAAPGVDDEEEKAAAAAAAVAVVAEMLAPERRPLEGVFFADTAREEVAVVMAAEGVFLEDENADALIAVEGVVVVAA